MSRIFISYAQEDVNSAEWIYDFLEELKLNPWMEAKDLLPGKNKDHTIRKIIRESDYFLALLSKRSLSQKGRVHKELKIAENESRKNPDNEIFVIPVRLDDCTIDNIFLENFHYLDLSHPSDKEKKLELEKLLKVIQKKQEENNTDSTSPLLQTDSKAVQELIEKFKKKELKPHPRKPHILSVSLLLMLLLALLYFLYLVHGHLKSANNFLNTGMYSKAIDEYEQAYNLCPVCPGVSTGRTKAGLFKKVEETDYDPNEMIQTLKNHLQDDPHILLLTANMNNRLGKYKKAEMLYLEITRNNPEIAEAWFSLGVMYNIQGKSEDARKMYEKAVSIAETNPRYLDNLAWMDFEDGLYDKAIQSYDKMLKANKNFLLACAEIAKALWMNKQPQAALIYQRILAEKIENKEITDLPANKSSWFFPVNGESVTIDKLNTKKYYVAYSLAATCYIIGLKPEAEKNINKAKTLSIGIEDKINIQALIDHDISQIQEEYPKNQKIKINAQEFRTQFLKR